MSEILPNISFIRVTDNRTKLMRLCSTLLHHFLQKENVLITVQDQKTAHFLDDMLWRMPEESFLPHVLTESPTEEQIVITTGRKNLNQAKILFNLCPQSSQICGQFPVVYELLDETDAGKEKLSLQRQGAYLSVGYPVRVI